MKQKILIQLIFVAIILWACSPIPSPVQKVTLEDKPTQVSTSDIIPRNTPSPLPTAIPSPSLTPTITRTLTLSAVLTEEPGLELVTRCLEILPQVPDNAGLEGKAILMLPPNQAARRYDFQSGRSEFLPEPPNTLSGGYDVSPDGTQLAYLKYNTQDNGQFIDNWIIVMDVEGNILVELPGNVEKLQGLYWLDNENLVLSYYFDPVILNPFTGWEFTLSDWYEDSPGGEHIGPIPWATWGIFDAQLSRLLFLKQDSSIVLYDLDNKEILTSLNPIAQYVSFETPKWSPDNSQVVFAFPVVEDPDKNKIELYSLSREGELTRLTRLADFYKGVHIWNFDWSPNGKQIAFIFSSEDQVEQLGVLDLESWELTNYCNISGSSGMLSHPIWSPDGTALILRRMEVDGETWSTVVVDLAQGFAAQLAKGLIPAAWMVNEP